MTHRRWLLLLPFLAIVGLVLGKGEYASRYLYKKTDPGDTGAIEIALAGAGQKPTRVVAVGRKSHDPYLGDILDGGAKLRWQNLPTDIYDILIVGDTAYYEGFVLTRNPDAKAAEVEEPVLRAELLKVEEFFECKRIERVEIVPADEGGFVGAALAQMWTEREILAESGIPLEGHVHSIDLWWPVKPAQGWQIPQAGGRRQLYREELPLKGPFAHHHVPDLGSIRVVGSLKSIGPVSLPAMAAKP